MSLPDHHHPAQVSHSKKPLVSFSPPSRHSHTAGAAQSYVESGNVSPSAATATIGSNSSRTIPNGKPSPLEDPYSVGSTTASLDMMSLGDVASATGRHNGPAVVAGRDAACPVAAGQTAIASALPDTPPAGAAAAVWPSSEGAASAAAVTSGLSRTLDSHSSSGRVLVSAGAKNGAGPVVPAPIKIDPHSVAAHVSMAGDDPAKAAGVVAGAAHNLAELVMGKTLGTGTFGRVRLVRGKRSGDFFALKIMTIQEVVRLKQIEHVKSEKNILQKIKHPFVVDLKWTHHDARFLYMLLEFVVGGELFSYLRAVGRFHTKAASFYAAEIVSALDHLHSNSIIYRDLKPENLLIDGQGHIKITDFGFAKELSQDNYTWTLCGTPEYLAPEIIQNRGHGKAVDWWALGILIYEMLVGYPPFFDDTAFGIYEKILTGAIDYPRFLESPSREIIKKLLLGDRTKRLGSMRGGTEDVKKHRFFRDYDFQKLREQKCKPPFVPTFPSSTANYAANFDDYEEEDLSRVPRVAPHDLAFFSDF